MVSQAQSLHRWLLVLRLESEIIEMIERAERIRSAWIRQFVHVSKEDKPTVALHVRNINALAGVIKALHWSLGNEESPLS
mgnify:FL=1|tara:strand:+ start:204 stop:443 length:240 start_codon:yes stop_codon:yes gene_type:complete